jgi:hypothetical protein
LGHKIFGPPALVSSIRVHEGSELVEYRGCTTFVSENDGHIGSEQAMSGLRPNVAKSSRGEYPTAELWSSGLPGNPGSWALRGGHGVRATPEPLNALLWEPGGSTTARRSSRPQGVHRMYRDSLGRVIMYTATKWQPHAVGGAKAFSARVLKSSSVDDNHSPREAKEMSYLRWFRLLKAPELRTLR